MSKSCERRRSAVGDHHGAHTEADQRDPLPPNGPRMHPNRVALLDRAPHTDTQQTTLGHPGQAEQPRQPRHDHQTNQHRTGLPDHAPRTDANTDHDAVARARAREESS